MALAALAGGLLAAATHWYSGPRDETAAARCGSPLHATAQRSEFHCPPMNSHGFTVSPDGQRIVYAADDRLFLRLLSEVESRPILGMEGHRSVSSPGVLARWP